MYEDVLSFKSLYEALKKCCRNVRWKDSTIGYEYNGLLNTYRLQQALKNNKYKIGSYTKFIIHEPKERLITATRIRDRQFQRSLCDNGFYEQITKHFIYDNGACLKNKGVDFSIKRITELLRRYYIKHGNTGWVLQCDIHHYFPSITAEVAIDTVNKYVTDKDIRSKVIDIINSFGNDGMGLGSQVIPLVALAVLNDMDHMIKEKLGIKYYERYADDFVLIHPDKEYLKQCLNAIRAHLKDKNLYLNAKTSIYPLSQGVKLLQWHFILTKTGKILKHIDPKKISKQHAKIKKLLIGEKQGKYPTGTAWMSTKCWLANASRGDTYFIRKNMVKYYKEMWGKING